MTLNDYAKNIADNQFLFQLRNQLNFDDMAYIKLIELLKNLKNDLRGHEVIPLELALYLYEIPYVIRNMLDHLKTDNLSNKSAELTEKVENAWIEIDDLVVSCLSINCQSD